VARRIHRPRRRTVALVLLAVLAVSFAGVAWYLQPQPLLPQAGESLAPSPDTAFQKIDGRLEWSPPSGHYTVGMVVYPGAKVPPEAYGPLAQRIAAHGYLVIIVPMPLNLAVLDVNAALPAVEAHPEVERWAIAGHSLGGAMAAQFITGHPGVMSGLAMWAAYPAVDLSQSGLAATSIYGTLDAGVDTITSPGTKALLPDSTVYVPIEGGNHEQMGWYTGQPNDPPATISREDQQAQVADATLAMLARVVGQ
jgi:hypothetical protein